jgi:hypothetical protein
MKTEPRGAGPRTRAEPPGSASAARPRLMCVFNEVPVAPWATKMDERLSRADYLCLARGLGAGQRTRPTRYIGIPTLEDSEWP